MGHPFDALDVCSGQAFRFSPLTLSLSWREVLRLQASITAVAQCPKPVIAAVHGYCIGGGVDLIAACDIRLASDDAVFSVREAKIAIVAEPLTAFEIVPRIFSDELATHGGPWLLSETLAMLTHLQVVGQAEYVGDDPKRWSATTHATA